MFEFTDDGERSDAGKSGRRSVNSSAEKGELELIEY
jgi:hypothetical protein